MNQADISYGSGRFISRVFLSAGWEYWDYGNASVPLFCEAGMDVDTIYGAWPQMVQMNLVH